MFTLLSQASIRPQVQGALQVCDCMSCTRAVYELVGRATHHFSPVTVDQLMLAEVRTRVCLYAAYIWVYAYAMHA